VSAPVRAGASVDEVRALAHHASIAAPQVQADASVDPTKRATR
jgi:hypothetical protein